MTIGSMESFETPLSRNTNKNRVPRSGMFKSTMETFLITRSIQELLTSLDRDKLTLDRPSSSSSSTAAAMSNISTPSCSPRPSPSRAASSSSPSSPAGLASEVPTYLGDILGREELHTPDLAADEELCPPADDAAGAGRAVQGERQCWAHAGFF